jgi:hypothetical protein
MSRCAFCGSQKNLGLHSFAHRHEPRRVDTVKVCEDCERKAHEAGFTVAEREPASANHPEFESGTTAP